MKRLTTLFALVVCLAASAAAAQDTNAQDIVLYVSDILSNDLHGSWTTQSDSTAAGGTLLATPVVGFSTTSAPLATPNDAIRCGRWRFMARQRRLRRRLHRLHPATRVPTSNSWRR